MSETASDRARPERPERARGSILEAMRPGNLRLAAILLFAAGAVLSGLGNSEGKRVLTALAFVCFGLGVVCVLRWRSRVPAKVLDREEKTPRRD